MINEGDGAREMLVIAMFELNCWLRLYYQLYHHQDLDMFQLDKTSDFNIKVGY